ncbi:MAG: hypothetical protein PHO07_11130 [Pirellulales bacterium]|jgi:hypothetical protein|nr:hypothetical protein [Thermoguttaceae bacterium]MDD4787719.1 hypothetical protein [Pirellulales bacterium]MDI9444290.1 hypothetical protein [Planctomycetota bacterium]NLZ00021.1 hypothetical protein [Pirellulaceae bacterium]
MARRLAAIVFLAVCFMSVSSVHAQFGWINRACDSVVTDFKRNNCFPEPFLAPDRAAVRIPFHIMVQNGWRLENTLGDHYFNEVTGQLTNAGENKIYWILNQAPKQHRTIFVQKTKSDAVNQQRIELVQALAIAYAPEGTIPRVEATKEVLVAWPADRVDQISRAFQESAPDPRLPAVTTAKSSGSGM